MYVSQSMHAQAPTVDCLRNVDKHDRAGKARIECLAGGDPARCYRKEALVATFDTTRNDFHKGVREVIDTLQSASSYPAVLLYRAGDKQPVVYELPDGWNKSAKSRKRLISDLLSFFRTRTKGKREVASEL